MKQNKETLKQFFETGDKPTQQQYSDLIDTMNTPFMGEIKMIGFNIVPQGWAKCDGQLLNIEEYQELFNLIGNIYGGDGILTFSLPDLRGRTPLGVGSNPELTEYLLGEKGGEENHVLTGEEMPSHTHSGYGTIKASDMEGTTDIPEGNYLAVARTEIDRSNIVYPNIFTNSSNIEMAENGVSVNINETGSNQPHNNIQPYLVVNYIIALEGRIPRIDI
ncbi:tail fiber protein [Tenacibaculum sp.]|uniref:phage tail protein n=1 Tax=Tenacibaculum sp. TaxID=1906242 RepID=UPI002359E8D8|nr:tail fiber protein [Tenacibaculum sp.]